MPFAALPSSPGFNAPQAPDWTRFAAQANEFIQRGGEMRARAGEQLSESIEKAATQIDSIIQNNSPEARAAKELKLEATNAQIGLYKQYRSMTPEERAKVFEFKGGMLQYKDGYKNMLQGFQLKNAYKRGLLMDQQLNKPVGDTDPVNNHMRAATAQGAVTGELPPDTNRYGNPSGESGASNFSSSAINEMLNFNDTSNEDRDYVTDEDQG